MQTAEVVHMVMLATERRLLRWEPSGPEEYRGDFAAFSLRIRSSAPDEYTLTISHTDNESTETVGSKSLAERVDSANVEAVKKDLSKVYELARQSASVSALLSQLHRELKNALRHP